MAAAVILGVGGCVGQNPWWDPPAEADGEDGESTLGDRGDDSVDPTGLDATTAGESSGSGTTILDISADGGSADATGEASTTTADGESAGDGASCDPPWAMCDGECREVQSDHHHCGVECIDCMEVYGSGTHCVDGVCDVDDDDDDDEEDDD